MNSMLDRAGILAGITCSVHCVAHGLLPAAFALGIFLGPMLEWTLVVLAVVFAVGGGLAGLRTHGSLTVVLPMFVFAALLPAGRFLGELLPGGELTWGVVAGLGLAIAHFLNLRACARKRNHPQELQ